MKKNKTITIILLCAIIFSVMTSNCFGISAQTITNPNVQAASISSVQAIRNSLQLVWNDEFGGEIGCGAEKQALPTTNGTDEYGNPTSDEVRKTAKWCHDRYRDGNPKTRNGQYQHYVIEDGRNSWTQDGILHLRTQREENGYIDPITKKSYHWTADGLRSSFFDEESGEGYFQAFRFGMLEAKIYTVNGKALEDENGNPVYDADGNIMQDPKYSQGLWNGFWTTGNPDMSKECAYIRNKGDQATWPYTGEIDICEAYNSESGYSTYNSQTGKTNSDRYGIIIKTGSIIIKTDSKGKILINDSNGNHLVQYDTSAGTYVVADGQETKYSVTKDSVTILSKSHTIRQDENGLKYIRDSKNKTIVDTEGNCYGSATLATAQLHYCTGQRYDGTLIDGVTENVKTTALGGGYKTSSGAAGTSMHGDSGYHTYGVYWTPTSFVYYCDDIITGYYDITDPKFFQLRECPQYIFLTFPVGGSVPGDPNPALDFSEYLVDYVRVYQADDGYNTDPNYQGSYGFPQYNDLAQPISYYDEISKAYSAVKTINVYEKCDVSGSGEKYIFYSSPFRSSGKVLNLKGTTTIKTQEKIPEGKYDVYMLGVARSNSKDATFSLNGVSVGTQMRMSDYAKDKYGREYGSAKSTYIGTADIVNGAHNLQINAETINQLQGNASKSGLILSIIIVRNDNSQATVIIDSDSEIETTPSASGGTTVQIPSGDSGGTNPDSQSYKWNLYTDKFTANEGYTMKKGSSESSFFNTKYASGGTYFWSSNNTVGNTVTLTSNQPVSPGVYSAKLYARSSGKRAYADIYINGVKVATNLNTGNSGEGAKTTSSGADVYNFGYDLNENTITINSASRITVRIDITDVSQSGHLYFNSIELTRIAEVESLVDVDTDPNYASVRLNDATGMRFYSSVSVDKIDKLLSSGYDVKLGTLIAPIDLLNGDLTFESQDFVDVAFDSKNQDGSYDYYRENDFVGIVASVINLKEENYAREYTARGYAKLSKDGETTVVYSNTYSNHSIKGIAQSVLNDSQAADLLTSAQIELLNRWTSV